MAPKKKGATAKKAAPKKKVAATKKKAAAPKKAVAKKAAPKATPEAAPKKAAPIDVAPKKAAPKKAAPLSRGVIAAATGEGKTVSLDVKFKNVEPGLSTLTATYLGMDKEIRETGKIQFDHVVPGKTIRVKGDSNGTTVISIDTDADPTEMEFEPGQHISGIFLIL